MPGLRNRISTGILIAVSIFYGYGAAVHVANIFSMTGFDWMTAPLKWQVLDVVYLGLDVLVAAGLWRRWAVSLACFFVAGLSQIALYTVGSEWILAVPEAFAPTPESVAYLDTLVLFHVISLVAVVIAMLMRRSGG